jgi:hypothetical protein
MNCNIPWQSSEGRRGDVEEAARACYQLIRTGKDEFQKSATGTRFLDAL